MCLLPLLVDSVFGISRPTGQFRSVVYVSLPYGNPCKNDWGDDRENSHFLCVASGRRDGQCWMGRVGEGKRPSGIRCQYSNRQRAAQQIEQWRERRETFVSVHGGAVLEFRSELSRRGDRFVFKCSTVGLDFILFGA